MRAWERLLAFSPKRRSWLVHIETWNELHEGSEICETRECGRRYIELTRRYADAFHAGRRIEPVQLEPFQGSAAALPDRTATVLKLRPYPQGDGDVAVITLAGRKAWVTRPTKASKHARYIYFDLADSFYVTDMMELSVEVQYLDSGPAWFRLEHDSCDPATRPIRRYFLSAGEQRIAGTGQWRRATFRLKLPAFLNRANGADFRLGCAGADLAVSSVTIRRLR
jgi:hypothetical protein